jgi:hypothetical protein
VLQVSECGLSDVWADADPASFASLEQLSLTGNALASVSAVDALDAFPRLRTLRLGPLDLPARPSGPELTAGEARQLLIGRLPRLESLNGSEVSSGCVHVQYVLNIYRNGTSE